VIKVEHGKRPDNSRLSGVIIRDGQRVEGQTTDMSPMFHQINKGKLGITLNLKEKAGVDLLKRLAEVSDIVLENMSAGTMERSEIGYDTLRSSNPGLIMAAMSGADSSVRYRTCGLTRPQCPASSGSSRWSAMRASSRRAL
jgi:formyl-CoA transferase